MRLMLAAVAAVSTLALTAARATPVDPQTLNRIADAGFNHGEVVETIEYLTDRIGGRMTNSPAMRQAEAFALKKYAAWGLKNPHREGFEFGRGWWIESSHVRMTAPRPFDLKAIPLAWSPATNGPVSGPVVLAPIRTEADFAKWHGKLKGKVVLLTAPTPPKDDLQAPFVRLADADIGKLDAYREPSFDPANAERTLQRVAFAAKLDTFLAEEGAVARAIMSRSEGRLVHGEGSGYKVGETPKVPAVEIAAEDYRRLVRLTHSGDVNVEIDNKVHYDDTDTKAYNIIADIPGTDPKAGYVMAGAHLDSWVAGDGASDNGAGAAVVMEAARILASLNLHPKRTIRFALWAGEEEGLWGSYAYTAQHLATRPPIEAARFGPFRAADSWPATPLAGFSEMNGYFNLDNGSGKIRGIYAEGNFAAAPVLKAWLAPFASMGAGTVVAERTGSTDHVPMVQLGLPAFQFIQDPLDYESRVHHTDLDTFDHLRTDDMRQAAVIMAAMLLDAAESDQPLPRNVLPTQPRPTDPYKFDDPAPPAR